MGFPLNYTGIADSLGDNDGRKEQLLTQYRETGMDDSEMWSLDYSICRYLSTRMICFKEMVAGKSIVMEPEFKDALDRMIEGFQLGVKDEGVNLCPLVADKDAEKKIQDAFDLLSKYHGYLWW